jgi:hypothetical protein
MYGFVLKMIELFGLIGDCSCHSLENVCTPLTMVFTYENYALMLYSYKRYEIILLDLIQHCKVVYSFLFLHNFNMFYRTAKLFMVVL